MTDDQTHRRRRSLDFMSPPHFTLTPPTGPQQIPDPVAAGAPANPRHLPLEDLALTHWRDFFCRFREDESDDVISYRESAAAIQERLNQLPFGKKPDAALAADMLEMLLAFDRSRFEELCYRLDSLSAACHQYTFQAQSAELSRCHQLDEIQRCVEMLDYAVGGKRLLTHPERLVRNAIDRLRKVIDGSADGTGAHRVQPASTQTRPQPPR
ncbi:MAG: hypothetical protein H0W83_06880 [Planctomycetes bacterium]|nr:hypothetical protein [Planctomycetota bacterium]